MKTHCNQKTFEFQTENSRKIVAHFNGGTCLLCAVSRKMPEDITTTVNYLWFRDCQN